MFREVELLPQDVPPCRHAVAIMSDIDEMPRPFRDLVREYGYSIVQAMIDDGENDPKMLRHYLRSWRARRQAELLAINIRLVLN